jgi:hypothetical protein
VKPAVSRLSSGTSEETFLITTEGLHLWVLRDEVEVGGREWMEPAVSD